MASSPLERDQFRLTERTVQGIRLRWWECGPADGPLIVFLHGFGGDHRGLMAVAELVPGHRLVLPDIPGWGESQAFSGPHTFHTYLEFFDTWFDELSPAPFILAGHSFGATVALYYASQRPDRLQKLILIEPVISAKTITSRIGQTYYKIGERLPEPLREHWVTSPLLNRVKTEIMTVTNDPQVKRKIVAHEKSNLANINDRVEIEVFKSFYEVNFLGVAKKISTPTVIIGGQRDQMTPVKIMEELAAAIPGAELIVIPEAGHFAPMEIPTLVAEVFSAALKK